MSYHIGQITSGNWQSTGMTLQSIQGSNTLKTVNLSSGGTLNEAQSFYLTFQLAKRSSVQIINLKITKSGTQSQLLETYTIPSGSGNVSFEIVFSPADNGYNQFVWQATTDATIGLSNIQCTKINNFISGMTLDKIGIQGPPSLLMCINGEQIRVGRSGVYQIDNIPITFLSILFKSGETFIIDYEYTD